MIPIFLIELPYILHCFELPSALNWSHLVELYSILILHYCCVLFAFWNRITLWNWYAFMWCICLLESISCVVGTRVDVYLVDWVAFKLVYISLGFWGWTFLAADTATLASMWSIVVASVRHVIMVFMGVFEIIFSHFRAFVMLELIGSMRIKLHNSFLSFC